jgi:hypothetical protein
LPIVATDEPVPFRVVEPLHRAFQSFHVRPPYFAGALGPVNGGKIPGTAKYAGIVGLRRGAVKDTPHKNAGISRSSGPEVGCETRFSVVFLPLLGEPENACDRLGVADQSSADHT